MHYGGNRRGKSEAMYVYAYHPARIGFTVLLLCRRGVERDCFCALPDREPPEFGCGLPGTLDAQIL